jgi:hypothetical protein
MAPAKKTCGILLGGAAFVLLLAGCAPPIPDGGFDANWSSTQPPDARRPPPIATLRQLVVMLESSDPAERLVASETLQMVTGEDFGYEPSAPLPERFLAVNRWRAWVDSRATPPSPAEGAGT